MKSGVIGSVMNRNANTIPFKEIGFHILFWILYIVSEYFANLLHMQPGRNLRFFQSILLTLPALMVPAYFIAWYVVPKYLHTNKWSLFILWILVVGIFVFFARIKWAEIMIYVEEGRYFKVPAAKILKNIIRDYAIIALGVCIYIIGDYRKKQKQNEQLIKAKAEIEIKLLKGQLQPHFLFNSLNNIYSLALMKSDMTADSILKLTELLDFLVYRANMDKVALSKEVQLLRNYIDLEKLRYGDKLTIQEHLDVENDGVFVAPLILLPFAENCFKHGGTGKDGIFHIQMTLQANEQELLFVVSNSKKTNKEKTSMHGGVGLENILQRLTLLYPNRHELIITEAEDTYRVQLKLKLKDA